MLNMRKGDKGNTTFIHPPRRKSYIMTKKLKEAQKQHDHKGERKISHIH